MIQTVNENVAVKPLVFDHEKAKNTQVVAGFVGTDKLAKSLIQTEVVFDSKTMKKGQKVYFRADIYNAPMVKNIMKIGEDEFILLPEAMVVAVERD